MARTPRCGQDRAQLVRSHDVAEFDVGRGGHDHRYGLVRAFDRVLERRSTAVSVGVRRCLARSSPEWLQTFGEDRLSKPGGQRSVKCCPSATPAVCHLPCGESRDAFDPQQLQGVRRDGLPARQSVAGPRRLGGSVAMTALPSELAVGQLRRRPACIY